MSRKIYVLLLSMLIIYNTTRVFGQSLDQKRDTESCHFDDYLALFASIDKNDTTLRLHEIEYRDYPYYTLIDSIYYPFADNVPYFDSYATFKIVKPKGILACVYHRYENYFFTLSFIDLISYSFEGNVVDIVRLPFYDNAVYFGKPDGFESCDLYISGKQIVYKYIGYIGNEDEELILDLKNYNITMDGLLEEY